MDELVERELTVPNEIEEVWRSLAEPEWLGEDASIELREAGEVRAGERSGFVEEAEAPRRLVFWWSAPGEEATRVELDLDETDAGTHIRVTESRPLAILDGRDLAIELGGGGRRRPAALRPRGDARGRAALMPADPGATRVFAALSDGTRRSLYATLGERGEATATDLARDLPVTRQAVQKHLGTLASAGLVATRRAGREVLYRPTPAPMSEALAWMAEVGAQWDDRLAALERQLARRAPHQPIG